MANLDYTYQVARIRYREKFCLNDAFIASLAQAQDVKECIRLLADKGWGDASMSAEEIIAHQRKELSSLMNELLGEGEHFKVFFMENDFHNLKAAIKSSLYPTTGVIYLEPNTVSVKLMEKCITENDFSALPEDMVLCAKSAFETLKETGDGQACDIIIDKALMLAQINEAKKSGINLFIQYAEHNAAVANIKVAVRALMANKGREFLNNALADCNSLSKEGLIAASENGLEGIIEYLSKTDFAPIALALNQSGALFEKECDNRLIRILKPLKMDYFTIEPVAAYYLARLNEIKTVQMLLTAKANGLEEKYVAERLRVMYV